MPHTIPPTRIRINAPYDLHHGRAGHVLRIGAHCTTVLLVKTAHEHAVDLAQFSSLTVLSARDDVFDGKKAVVLHREVETAI